MLYYYNITSPCNNRATPGEALDVCAARVRRFCCLRGVAGVCIQCACAYAPDDDGDEYGDWPEAAAADDSSMNNIDTNR